jgi:hypothetical protein
VLNKVKTTILTGAMLAASAAPVFAVENPIKFDTLGALLGGVFTFILGIVGALALIFLAIGGIQYMTSGGDKFAVEAARGRITAAVVGLLVVFGAWLVINVIGTFMGVEGGLFD